MTQLELVIGALTEGLADDADKERVREGVTYLANKFAGHAFAAMMLKMTLPMFTRTVHARHGLDVPVTDYADSLCVFINSHSIKYMDGNVTVLDPKVLDDEADYLAELCARFMA